MNISDYMRQVALHSEVKAKWTPKERGMVKMLIGMSVDLHSLKTVAEEQGVVAAAELFQRYRDIPDELIKKLCEGGEGVDG